MQRQTAHLLPIVLLATGLFTSAETAELVVTTTAPFAGPADFGDGLCTLDEAVLSANTNGTLGAADCGDGAFGLDTIVLGPGIYSLLPSDIVLEEGLGALRESLHLAGAGAGLTTVLAADRGSAPLVVELAAPPVELILTALTLAGDERIEGFRAIDLLGAGYTGSPRDLYLVDAVVRDFDLVAGSGGAINATVGMVTVLRTTITRNSADNGGGLFAGFQSVVLVQDSTVSHNAAHKGLGGGLMFGSSVNAMVVNSTITHNQALSVGGIFATSGSVVDLNNITVSENSGDLFTGGIRTFGVARMRNSIVLVNDPLDCSGTVVSANYNVVGLGMGCPDDGTGDQGVDPSMTFTQVLGPLELGEGTTQTYVPLPGSPAVDAGDPAGCLDVDGTDLAFDQAGSNRPVDGDGDGLAVCDVGAVELQLALTPGDQIVVLSELLLELGLHRGTLVSLASKLRNALRRLADGNVGAAINNLHAFIQAVEAQRGKKIASEDADTLIAAVLAIIDGLMTPSAEPAVSGTAPTLLLSPDLLRGTRSTIGGRSRGGAR